MFAPEGPGWAEREMQLIMALLAHKWVLAVLASLADGPLRHRELHGSLPGVSDKVLAATLRRLEREGLVPARGLPDVAGSGGVHPHLPGPFDAAVSGEPGRVGRSPPSGDHERSLPIRRGPGRVRGDNAPSH